jgi:hypothetical protein
LFPIACRKTALAVSVKSRFSLFCCFFDLRFVFGMSNPATDQRSAKSSSSNWVELPTLLGPSFFARFGQSFSSPVALSL